MKHGNSEAVTKFDTLVQDIYNLSRSPHEVSEDNLADFLDRLAGGIRDHFLQTGINKREPALRFSNLGLPSRKLWYKIHRGKEYDAKQRVETPQLYIKFLFGHILEALLFFLVREAGHEITDEQKLINVEGIQGRTDGRIDGVPVDIKSAAKSSFKKFQDGSFHLDEDGEADSFGYKHQLRAYMEGIGDDHGAFLVINKETGELLTSLHETGDLPDVFEKIEREKVNLSQPNPPEEKCYQPVVAKNGNETLHTLCTFCEFKEECWSKANDGKGLQKRFYARGPVYFTKLVKEPYLKSNREEKDNNVDQETEN